MLGKASAAPIPVEEALQEKSRLVVLGDPGSGKTTLLKHLALRLAAQGEGRLPVLLPLSAYAAALQRDSRRHLADFLPEHFAGQSPELAGLAPLFKMAQETGQALVLLDGLDEVQAERQRLVQKVETFAGQAVAQGNKIIVTSRIVGYRDDPLQARDWALYTLLDFDRPAIEAFAERWCRAFEKSTLGDTPDGN